LKLSYILHTSGLQAAVLAGDITLNVVVVNIAEALTLEEAGQESYSIKEAVE
jgi:flagellar basal body rod protein FlgC